LERDYKAMAFELVQDPVQSDPSYQADVIAGISSVRSKTPDLRYSPMSESLMQLAYEQLTPLMEKWVGQPLERSWAYGVRSYGPGSWLHMHRDRMDTHVVSCIIHVDDQSNEPWPLDFIDHEAVHHKITFKPGQMLFYESLCPHGRASEFDGKYYRNMYFHWRPSVWNPAECQHLMNKFSSVEEAQKCNQDLALIASIPETWRDWLSTNHERGCNHDDMIQRAMAHGLERPALEHFLASKSNQPSKSRPDEANEDNLVVDLANEQRSSFPTAFDWFDAPLTYPEHSPRAWRLDTPRAQVYEIPQLLSREECQCLIEAIDESLQPSTVTRGSSDYRTSRTCHLRHQHPRLSKELDQRFADLLGVDPKLSEPIQGQRYDVGEYFKQHTDWFAPGTKEYATNTRNGGQRTWTIMVYLNAVELGGETKFKRLDRSFVPQVGTALAWNNLLIDGSPNPFTLHEAMPIEIGSKWVITKWFREQMGRNG
jgi:prolyl 4-hydroxylase